MPTPENGGSESIGAQPVDVMDVDKKSNTFRIEGYLRDDWVPLQYPPKKEAAAIGECAIVLKTVT